MRKIPSKVVPMSPAELKARPQNSRTHSKRQIRKIAESVRQFGFVNPVLIDPEGVIIAGHGRVEAAKLLGFELVPTIRISHLKPEAVRAYVIADNKLALEAGWDREILALELQEIAEIAPELDLTVTGFEVEEIELLQDVRPVKRPRDDPPVLEPSRDQPSITQLNDIWEVGRHRLLCGNALDREAYKLLLAGETADLVITDPPYNVPISGHVCGRGRHHEFVMASGEMSRPQFQRFLADVCANLARFSRSGSLHYIFMDWRSIADLIAAGEQSYDVLLNIIVWAKPNGGLGSLYRSRHELVALFKRGKRPHTNNVELGAKTGRYRTNVWEYPGSNTFTGSAKADLALHPTVKNLEMIVDAIKDASRLDEIVLDPFAGSGTTLLAAQRAGRVARLVEIDPYYCDTVLRRALAAGLPVSSAETGETFGQVEARRSMSVDAMEAAE